MAEPDRALGGISGKSRIRLGSSRPSRDDRATCDNYRFILPIPFIQSILSFLVILFFLLMLSILFFSDIECARVAIQERRNLFY